MTHIIKYLLSALAGTVVYAALSMTAGQNGVWAYQKLSEQKMEISAHTSQLQRINDELSLEHTALEKDGDVIAAYARKLDYIGENEKLVKINGLKPSQMALYDTGTVMKSRKISYLPEAFCKAAGLIVFILTLILMLMSGYHKRDKKRNAVSGKQEIIQGIPVYDVPQI